MVGAYSSKARIANLKKLSEAVSYLKAKQLYTTDDLNAALHTMQDKIGTLKKSAAGNRPASRSWTSCFAWRITTRPESPLSAS